MSVAFVSLQQRKLGQKVRGALRRRSNYVSLPQEFKVTGLTVGSGSFFMKHGGKQNAKWEQSCEKVGCLSELVKRGTTPSELELEQ